MTKVYCFSALLVWKRKKSKGSPKVLEHIEGKRSRALLVKAESLLHPTDEKGLKVTSVDILQFATQGRYSTCDVEVLENRNLDGTEAVVEGPFEDGGEHDDISSMRRDLCIEGHGDSSLEEQVVYQIGLDVKCERCEGAASEPVIKSGHLSDLVIRMSTSLWGSLMLKRSCFNIETRAASRLLVSPSKFLFYDAHHHLLGNVKKLSQGFCAGPLSVMNPFNADRVMLKKRSPNQVLPSSSLKLWWKLLFLCNHRNLHKPWIFQRIESVAFDDDSKQKGGYSSDMPGASHAIAWRSNKSEEFDVDSCRTDLCPLDQWVDFFAESSSIDRVDAWVKSLEDNSYCLIDDGVYDRHETQSVGFANSPEVGEFVGRNKQCQASWLLTEEVVKANNIIKSLNSHSSVTHISGMSLKVIPAISAFSTIRALNLSKNFIVHITMGTLPKNLRTLDLSRNRISAIEGLRDLTRLRVLNLNYNKISRIGHGLSNCPLIKELYLAGNKISNIEGLHRLLKLSVLDLSLNRIATAKALGRLVANYSSLLALNLHGNPIQGNSGDDQLRKVVTSLLPQLAFLNKQPIKLQRGREAATGNIAKAALRNGGWKDRRRSTWRTTKSSRSSV